MNKSITELQELIANSYQLLQTEIAELSNDFSRVQKGEEQGAKRARNKLIKSKKHIDQLRIDLLEYSKLRKSNRKRFTYL